MEQNKTKTDLSQLKAMTDGKKWQSKLFTQMRGSQNGEAEWCEVHNLVFYVHP